MEAKEEKFKIEVRFSKNRHYPEYGDEVYSTEGHSIYIPYGKKFHFKSSNKATEFVKERIDSGVLERFDSISITKWNGCTGTCEYLKQCKEKSDTKPIDKEFAEIVLSF